ncbi:MAG: aldehyde dehydrogenase family protein [Candidatus Nanopelagicales bacterium]
MSRIDVRKTYKLYINGAFPRSESGRSYEVLDAGGRFAANAALASRKDARDAVVAARSAFKGWSHANAYLRGQIVYRIAEVMESRRAQLVADVMACEGLTEARAKRVLDAAIDRVVWYAGWADKLPAVLGNANAVSGPFFNFSVPEPSGVIAIVAPEASSLLALVSVTIPVVVAGNTCVVVTSRTRPLPAITWAECLATSDLPNGVVNLLTGDHAEIAPWLASHKDVDGIDLSGVEDAALARSLEAAAAVNLKRFARHDAEEDWAVRPNLRRLSRFLETKTVWHPIGV